MFVFLEKENQNHDICYYLLSLLWTAAKMDRCTEIEQPFMVPLSLWVDTEPRTKGLL